MSSLQSSTGCCRCCRLGSCLVFTTCAGAAAEAPTPPASGVLPPLRTTATLSRAACFVASATSSSTLTAALSSFCRHSLGGKRWAMLRWSPLTRPWRSFTRKAHSWDMVRGILRRSGTSRMAFFSFPSFAHQSSSSPTSASPKLTGNSSRSTAATEPRRRILQTSVDTAWHRATGSCPQRRSYMSHTSSHDRAPEAAACTPPPGGKAALQGSLGRATKELKITLKRVTRPWSGSSASKRQISSSNVPQLSGQKGSEKRTKARRTISGTKTRARSSH
mmetsp:Transcript_67104/g.185854  ORF Transcript_67104/g.185854 Transcript_67104/m.185854 type:complete len:276 (+) Transcript_67104:1428-2255(+)